MELAQTGRKVAILCTSSVFRLYADVLKQGVPPYHPTSRSLVLKHTIGSHFKETTMDRMW